MNYAVVGNLSPHIHLHLVPQFFSDDPTLPLNMQAGARRKEFQRIVHARRQALGSATNSVSQGELLLNSPETVLVVVVYHVLRSGKPYTELGVDYFNNLDASRIERHHVRRLEQLGYKVSLSPMTP
jgi:hypothetical protein